LGIEEEVCACFIDWTKGIWPCKLGQEDTRRVKTGRGSR
jgi:hypothetical protein